MVALTLRRHLSHRLTYLLQNRHRTVLLQFCSTRTLLLGRRSTGGGANGNAKIPSGTARPRRLDIQLIARL
jgi:hypothetical protein